jgi:ribonuclease R
MEPLEQRILSHVQQQGYQPVKPRVIAKRLGVPQEQAAEVRRAVKRLVRRGQLAYGSGHAVLPAEPTKAQTGRLVGTFQRTKNGYGFVRPNAPPRVALPACPAVPGEPTAGEAGSSTPADGTRSVPATVEDIYIPAKYSRDASTGDVVAVQLLKRRPRDPGPRGEIVDVLERQTHQFVGTYFESAGASFVQVDGNVFAQPIYVGDPGAKGAANDDIVVFEMVRFPSPLREGEGVITEVLGPRGKPGVDTLSIMRELDLPDAFPEDVLEESRGEADRFDESIPPERTDLTGETVVTIDPVDARDFDDAISLVRLEDGRWRLGVHIADVSYFVRPKTALDREARGRATSVYLPDRVLPMLPEVISNSLASLQPGKVRYTKSAILEFTAEGQRVATELCSAAIRSSRRLTYEEVDAFLADPGPWRKKLGPAVHDLLGRMHALAMIFRKRRMTRGALELNMPEVKIDLDKKGRVVGARVVENTESHQIIEEFMLAANEAVAESLAQKEIAFLRRIHPSPEPRKLKALTEFVTELGFRVPSLQSRFALQKLLEEVNGKPEQHAVNFAALRSLQRAEYSPEKEGHYALASDCYCHFTSPIRRYPDLTIHRLVDDVLAGRTPRQHYEELVLLGRHCSDREQRAETAERELVKLKLLHYLSTRIGEEMDALITGVQDFGLFVQGVELPAEGLIHSEALVDDFYHLDRATHSLVGRRAGNVFQLGDRVRVAVARVDLDRRELDFRLVRRLGRPPTRTVAGAATGKSPRKKGTSRKPIARRKPKRRKGR